MQRRHAAGIVMVEFVACILDDNDCRIDNEPNRDRKPAKAHQIG